MTALSPRLEQIFSQTKPVCFGRFVIDIPATATVVYGRMTVDFEIAHFAGEAIMTDERIADQVIKLEKERYLYGDMNTPGSLYGKILEGRIAGHKTFVGAGDDSYRISSYVPVAADLYVFETSSIANTREVKKEIGEVEAIAVRLRARADSELPIEPGICLEGGFVNFNPTFENISMGIRLTEFPDVHLSISTLKNRGKPDEHAKLEFRLQAAERTAVLDGKGELYKSIKFLRRAPRQMGDWVGEEALARMPAEKGAFSSHQFDFYAMGAGDDILHPVADVQLDTGVSGNKTKAKPPSVTDDEAVALWDRLTSTIRPRPTTPMTSARN